MKHSVYEKSIRDNLEVNLRDLNELNSFLKVNSKSYNKDFKTRYEKEKILKFEKEKILKLEKKNLNEENEYLIYMPKKNYEKINNANNTFNKNSEMMNSNNVGVNPNLLKPAAILTSLNSKLENEKFFAKSDQNNLRANQNLRNSLKLTINNEEIDFMKFKSNYLLKFASNHEYYDKILNYSNLVSLNNQKLLREYLKSIKSVTDRKERILFDKFDNNGINLNHSITKDCTKLFYEFEYFWLRLCEVLFKEIKSLKDENINLMKKIKDEENSKFGKEDEIKKLNKLVVDNDLNYKSIVNGKKLKDLNEIKEDYEKKEKINLMNTFRLEEEIRELTSLLEKEREFYNKHQEAQATISQKKKEIEDMRTKFSQEMEEKKIRISFLNNEKSELIKKMITMEKEIKAYHDFSESSKKEHIEYHTQIKILKQSLTEKEENIQMLSEEMNQWMNDYLKERTNHFNTQQTVTGLEIKINSMKREKMNQYSKMSSTNLIK